MSNLDSEQHVKELQEADKPCNATCAKCGSTDACRRHRLKGECWNVATIGARRVKRASEFVKCDEFVCDALAECITHTCRICGWEWETPVLGQEDA